MKLHFSIFQRQKVAILRTKGRQENRDMKSAKRLFVIQTPTLISQHPKRYSFRTFFGNQIYFAAFVWLYE